MLKIAYFYSLELFGNKIMHQIVNSLDKKPIRLSKFGCRIMHSVNFKLNNYAFHDVHKLISEQAAY